MSAYDFPRLSILFFLVLLCLLYWFESGNSLFCSRQKLTVTEWMLSLPRLIYGFGTACFFSYTYVPAGHVCLTNSCLLNLFFHNFRYRSLCSKKLRPWNFRILIFSRTFSKKFQEILLLAGRKCVYFRLLYRIFCRSLYSADNSHHRNTIPWTTIFWKCNSVPTPFPV